MIGRLKRRAEFLQVAAANKKWVAPGLILQVCRHSRSETVNATRKGGADLLRPVAGASTSPASDIAPVSGLPVTIDTASASPAAAPMRVGFTASRKVGNAVKRNRAKRRLRAAVDLVIEQHGAPGHDVVLIARQSTLTREFPALIQDLTKGLQKLGAYQSGKQP
ncbi:MAG TPA: ribonuclease P protein component [Dongiaceae bacterium]